jgi:glycosyltransferase involved in cell wall biosynthesis
LADDLAAPVTFLGFLSGEALWAEVDGARAIVLPSEWYENGPMSVIEAFARGKPLLGARIGGIPELIIEGETGWSFVSGDSDDLAAGLAKVAAASRTELAAMGQATRAFVEAHHARERYFERMTALYEQVTPG